MMIMPRIPLTVCYPRYTRYHFNLLSDLLSAIQDHFGLILNEPAGKIAQVVVEHTVNLIVQVSLTYPSTKHQCD